MCGDAIDRAAGDAHLRPAAPAMLTGPAAAIVVHHDTGADPSGLFVDLAPHRSHHPAWRVAGYDRALKLAKPERRGFAADRPVELEIAAAHPRRLDFDDNVMGTGCRVGKFSDLQFTSAQETHPAHRALPKLLGESRMRARLRATGAGRGYNSVCASSARNAQPALIHKPS